MQCFYMMAGLPGSGKSYYAQRIPGAVIHSSDAIREEILGDASDQSNPKLIFQLLYDRIFKALRAGENVVYDATNVSSYWRKQFLCQIRELHIPNLQAVCVFMNTPYSRCLERNAARERNVPEDVIKRMSKRLNIPTMDEGWNEIHVVN